MTFGRNICPTEKGVTSAYKTRCVCLSSIPDITLPAMFFEEIPGFSGPQFTLGNVGYDDHTTQYASSTYQLEHNMQPGLVAYPKNKEDIKTAVKYAKGKGIRIACRTGGHQYSGASSTGEENIILDLSNSFRQEGVDRLPPTSDGHVFTSVSWNLKEFNEFLGNHNVSTYLF